MLKQNINIILNKLDHFSKFLFTSPIRKKCGKTIVTILKQIFTKYGLPEIWSDNDSKFVKKNVKKLLNDKNILFVHGRPYNLHSQGTVERVHRTVSNALIWK